MMANSKTIRLDTTRETVFYQKREGGWIRAGVLRFLLFSADLTSGSGFRNKGPFSL